MIEAIVFVILGCFYGNFMEWMIHKYFLHGLGKKPKSILSFHWREHHRLVRLNKYRDPSYDNDTYFGWNPKTKELLSLSVVAIPHLPLFWVAPVFAVTIFCWVGIYYACHVISHKRPDIGKKYFRSHYEHHMGKDQDKNFCVSFPLFDYILGTRKKYENSELAGGR